MVSIFLTGGIRRAAPADGVEIIEGSIFDRDGLARAMAGIDTAYYPLGGRL